MKTHVPTPVDGTPAIADPSTAGAGQVEPSTRKGGRRGQPVDGPPPAATYAQAIRFAQAKGTHRKPAGSLELPADTWGYYNERTAGTCQGQLRSAYARLTVETAHLRGSYYRTAGKPKWVPVGVWCDGCHAFWSKPTE